MGNDFKNGADLNLVERGSRSGEDVESPTTVHSDEPSQAGAFDRYINLASVVNFGVIILASWESFAVTFQFALTNGGPASIFYGSILAGFGACAVGFSLAELASIDPTVGAQYRWSANFAPAAPRFWGLLQGWITTAAWCFACGGPPSILANIITSLAVFNYENYAPERWHTSLIMIAIMIIPFMFNLWFRKLLDAFEMTGGILHITLFIVVIVILVVFGPRNDAAFVFKTLTSDVSGWNNSGVSWGLGLLSMTFSVTGADSVLHMCIIGDEVKKVRTRVPRSIILACTVNSAMLIVFATILLFYMGPLTDEIVATPLPLLWIIYGITGSKVATNVLISLIAVIFFFALFNIFASVSRLVWVFARDNGLPFSSFFSYVHPTLKLPLNALLLVGSIVTCLSLIYIASATAFNALISLQAFALHISYFFPILFFLLRKLRGPMPPYGPFKMGAIGVPVNIFALCYIVYVVLWMPFPQVLPVTKDNMNYAGPIFGAVVVGALAHWFIRGRKTFSLPIKRYE
ncbi:amino acid transporter [Dothidotthia symphoricarpi CBS 119687]|uniref:Amino acid transporter n=1 Tax=Dothidotthia symphoricarpi CBS 119687 TaxID=1392245 RepID=A0A6A6A8N0_9PLEO|nr:amino acid transporter [Dothidotthia symphoricarpi CBS 119687]KAF2127533.1 amino acid transporter [Dothidotthia symphoricarpi CBS 119687]